MSATNCPDTASSPGMKSGQIFHTYSVFARGTEDVGTVYGFLDITPKGRNEPPGDQPVRLGPPSRQI